MAVVIAQDLAAGHPHMLHPEATMVVPYGRRVRATAGGRWVIDTDDARLVWLPGGPPVPRYAFDPARIDATWLSQVDPDAVVRVDMEGTSDVAELVVVIDQDAADAWFEEDEQVHVHPRDPYGRVEVRASSRRVVVRAAGAVVADSLRPQMLFETGLPVRIYLPRADVRQEMLVPSSTRTVCPYKGVARHFHLQVDGRRIDDAVWSYPLPRFDLPQITDHVCFYEERVDAVDVCCLATAQSRCRVR